MFDKTNFSGARKRRILKLNSSHVHKKPVPLKVFHNIQNKRAARSLFNSMSSFSRSFRVTRAMQTQQVRKTSNINSQTRAILINWNYENLRNSKAQRNV